MRPLRLDLAGFTVFREETTVDFTDADFFALVGPTGSGKSSILDAICFALYGVVPRWGSSRGIASALAPSATEARVRLVFESAGSRYVATRVIRRDSRGAVKTGNAGLQMMPPGFDVTRLDTGMSPDDLGEVLAGTPAEMEQAVLDAVGLPYEQFTTCVLLPQGRFADFLHAKPATRQQILVNLLGLHVYERVRERATARAGAAEAAVAAVDQLLGGLCDADEAAVAAAARQVDAMRALATAVDAALPRLTQAQQAVATAADQVTALDSEIGLLAGVAAPAATARLADQAAAARVAAADADRAVADAEEREEKVRAELAAIGDPADRRLLLQTHAERDRVAAESAELAPALAAAQAEQVASQAALRSARSTAEAADRELDRARQSYQEAQSADLAAALRHDLVAGADCPVCAQPVGTVPPVPAGSRVAEAKSAGQAARAAANAAAEARENLAGWKVKLENAEGRLEESVEIARNTFQRTPEGLLAIAEAGLEDAEMGEFTPRDAERKADELRRTRDQLGGVNMNAEEEAADLEERLGAQVTEKEDLVAAIAKLRQGVDALNAEGRERLLAAFETVNEHFKALFTALFRGGQAELRLVDADDPLQAGLEIMAQPPGKKLGTLNLMSGGEQALTAAALIFAVFLSRPAPICVLDEVDAPLDDANVDRFCNMLNEMRQRTDTRFVVITHNPVTMSRMDRLFGVTMREKGVSKLVSVDLQAAEELVAAE